jgi:hypothetical protein
LAGYLMTVQVTTDAWGRLQLLGIGGDSALWVDGETAANSATFSGWQSLGGTALQQIEVANDAAGLPVLFARGGDNAVYYKWEYSPGSWSGWNYMGGNIQSISVGLDYGGKLVVAALGWNDSLYINTQAFPNSVAFGGWQSLGGWDLQQLALANDASGRLTIYALGGDHAVYYKQEDSSDSWSGWNYLGGNVQSIAAGRDAYGRMEVVGIDSVGEVWAVGQTSANGSWGGWYDTGSGYAWPASLVLGNEADGSLDVFGDFDFIDISMWGYTRL